MNRSIVLVAVLMISCVNHRPQIKEEPVCIDTFFISLSKLPNPDAVVFIIKTNDSLRQAFRQNCWDSITFSGGIFDTINYNGYNQYDFEKRNNLIEPLWTEKKPEDYFIAFISTDFMNYSQEQVDSIVALTIPKAEITIGAFGKIWKIRKCDDSCLKK